MDRQIVYPGSIPLDTDILSIQRNAMIALGYLAQATLGTGTVVDGLACAQTTVASMVVNVGQGSIVALETIDTTAFGSLASDSDPLVKIGINAVGVTPFTLTAPTTSGQSINYLIEASFQESDTTSIVLPYYNASNPSVPYSGPGNAGTAQNTQRLQRVNLVLKTGTAATTGSQVTPTPDSGAVGLWVVTVAYGATTVVNANIARYSSASLANEQAGTGMRAGRLINVQTFTTPGTAVYAPTAGTNKIQVTVKGGGGAGGGPAATSAGEIAVTGGGASGSLGIGIITSAFSGVTVTVGAAGAGASGATGGSGGTSSFGTIISAPGGAGGATSAASSGAANAAGGVPGAAASGGSILNINGQSGATGTGYPGVTGIGGAGGSGQYGSGGPWGTAASGYGAGGGGLVNGSSSAAGVGLNGSAGFVMVEEFS